MRAIPVMMTERHPPSPPTDATSRDIVRHQRALWNSWDPAHNLSSWFRYHTASPLRRLRAAMRDHKLPRRLPGRVLEFGFGHGNLLFFFRPPTAVYGVDLSEKAVDAASRRAARHHFAEYSFTCPPTENSVALSFPSEYFDVVLTSHTLEHVVDDEAVLTEFCRVLKPGGQLFLAVPCDLSHDEPVLERASRRNPKYPQDSFHVWLYNRATIRELVARAGLRPVTTERFDAVMHAISALHPVFRRAFSLLFPSVPFSAWRWLDRRLAERGWRPQQALVVALRPPFRVESLTGATGHPDGRDSDRSDPR